MSEAMEIPFDVESVAQANDAFRKTPIPDPKEGKWVMTTAVHVMGPHFVTACVCAIAAFDSFTEDNDPYGERSFGVFEIEGRKVYWKIDCYDIDYRYGSPDPLDPEKTRRVLTILFPGDW